MKKFKAGRYCGEHIEEVEVERETDQCVWIKGCGGKEQRFTKRSTYDNYFDTFEEARGYLHRRAEARLRTAQNDLRAAEKHMDEIIALRKPESKEAGK